ncbi:hypothetical protein C9975_04375 [Thalassospira xiamenensis]|nr:hypothetical protein C9975_04375 [Thalassospira xiamenensis]
MKRIIFLFLLVSLFSNDALSQVYFINLQGEISRDEVVSIDGNGIVNVILAIDHGMDVDRIIEESSKYNDRFRFVFPNIDSGKYTVLFSSNSTEYIINRYINSDKFINSVFAKNNIIQENLSCFIRIVYGSDHDLISYNMFVLDGSYESYRDCLAIYYSKFLEMSK